MKNGIVVIAHNIRSLWNVGSLFRNADCFGVEKIYLTGYTAIPPRREISKTALGAEEWIPWEYSKDPEDVIKKLKNYGCDIVGLEITSDAVNIAAYKSEGQIALLIGHEVTGIPKNLLKKCDDVVYIPMHGKKESLNVSVATGIALERLTHFL